MADKSELIDVRQMMASTSVEELNRLAEEYFARIGDWNYHLAKPFGAIDEVPQLLINFAVILQGLAICPGMTVLEFGAGTGWASHFLTQLGCRVIALDISPTALSIGAELYRRQPVFGERPPPQFLQFDGHHIDLPDNHVDRIVCLDAFHHIPNPGEVLQELGRVLQHGGIAGFAEPGPQHSLSPQSQYEMRTFKVVENDVEIREIWRLAQRAGFTDMKLAVFNVPAFHLQLDEFEKFLNGGSPSRRYAEAAVAYMQNQRSFFLGKGEVAASDSRYRTGLKANIKLSPRAIAVNEGEHITLQASVKNNSASIWLPRSAGLGAVLLGCHVYDGEGKIFHHSYHWEALTPGDGRPIAPGATVEFEVKMPPLPKGSYQLEFDMVSNDVCWFALNGSPTVRVAVSVMG
ncbi:MAG: methyltransferase domain-containing protein [Pyrinomonadaceae bacterium]